MVYGGVGGNVGRFGTVSLSFVRMMAAYYKKKNRVTAAQFASIEAIANTPRSPRFFFIIAF